MKEREPREMSYAQFRSEMAVIRHETESQVIGGVSPASALSAEGLTVSLRLVSRLSGGK